MSLLLKTCATQIQAVFNQTKGGTCGKQSLLECYVILLSQNPLDGEKHRAHQCAPFGELPMTWSKILSLNKILPLLGALLRLVAAASFELGGWL